MYAMLRSRAKVGVCAMRRVDVDLVCIQCVCKTVLPDVKTVF